MDGRLIDMKIPAEPPPGTVVLNLTNGLAYQRDSNDDPTMGRRWWHPAAPVGITFNPTSWTWALLVASGPILVLTTGADLARIQEPKR